MTIVAYAPVLAQAIDSATIQVVCAWCGKSLGTVDDPGGEGGVSHGICADCAKKFLEQK